MEIYLCLQATWIWKMWEKESLKIKISNNNNFYYKEIKEIFKVKTLTQKKIRVADGITGGLWVHISSGIRIFFWVDVFTLKISLKNNNFGTKICFICDWLQSSHNAWWRKQRILLAGLNCPISHSHLNNHIQIQDDNFIKFDKCDHIQPKKFSQLQKSLKPDENQLNSFTFDIRRQAANLITFYIYQQIPWPSTEDDSIGVGWWTTWQTGILWTSCPYDQTCCKVVLQQKRA